MNDKFPSKDISIPCSVVVLTKNEETNIRKCLKSASGFQEIFVVDSLSTDRTRELAREMGASVVTFQWNGQYPKKKQWALENLPFTTDWVLYLDADEQLTSSAIKDIASAITHGSHSGYIATYDYVFANSILAHGSQIQKLILFNRYNGKFIEQDDLEASNMWEVEGHYQPLIQGTVGRIKNHIIHDDHESLFHYFDRHNRYSDWEAVMQSNPNHARAIETHDAVRLLMKRAFARIPAKPVVAFAHSYLFKLGFLDGRAGLNFALARAFYYWQVALKTEERRALPRCHQDDQNSRMAQTKFYDNNNDPEYEIRRPHGTPRLYQQFLREKLRLSIAPFVSISGKSALSVCGGSGMDAEFLARAGAEVVTTDMSGGASLRAQKRFRHFLSRSASLVEPLVVTADAEHLPFPDQSIDLVYVHDGLHHLEDPAIGLREMCRVASWAVSLTEPADAALTGLAVKLGRAEEIEEAGNRVARLDLPTVTRILESEGFTVVRAQRYAMYYKHKPGWVMRLLSLPVLNSLAWLGFDIANALIGRWGNKMTVQAIRAEQLDGAQPPHS